ncbi:hypothetical protein RRF57_008986 [Xylaria bambusicola]|uniref:Uncharacterized protein n=1 Tax=Xylaria bambusicola TaxID=326684 RepID=A0AAN7Z7H6_9PEZI
MKSLRLVVPPWPVGAKRVDPNPGLALPLINADYLLHLFQTVRRRHKGARVPAAPFHMVGYQQLKAQGGDVNQTVTPCFNPVMWLPIMHHPVENLWSLTAATSTNWYRQFDDG